MAKRKTTRRTPEEQAAYDERTRLIRERIAYHTARLERRDARRRRPFLLRWLPR